jgi:hypothetical protein
MTPSPFGTGDLISITVGIAVWALAVIFVEQNRKLEKWPLLVATGMSLGTLGLLVAEPVAEVALGSTKLLTIVMSEGRGTLWWGALVASIYLVRDILPPVLGKPPP